MAHQVLEQTVFARQKVDGAPTPPHLALEQIHFQITDPQHGLAIRHAAVRLSSTSIRAVSSSDSKGFVR
jgi:hypothetical protein